MANNRDHGHFESPSTIAIHGGARADQFACGSVIPPVFHSTVYRFKDFDEFRRYTRGELKDRFFYARYSSPTVAEVEKKIAALEGAESAVVTASGSAAAFVTLAALCEAGDEILACDSSYGGTIRILSEVLPRFQITTRFLSIDEMYRLAEVRGERTRAVWFETPTNPVNRVIDIERVARSSREAGLFSVIDNTFATPILQQPLKLGIDAVVHSATKYFGGHSDLTAGAIVGNGEFIARARRLGVLIGTTLDPAAAYLLDRGLKTLELRVLGSCENALKLARAISEHAKISRVFYPGLEDSPDHLLARRQMRAFGGVVAFDLVGGETEAGRFLDALKMIPCAASLGGVETLASYPCFSSHAGFSDDQLKAAGVSPATVRFAVGIEDSDDIIADVFQALKQV